MTAGTAPAPNLTSQVARALELVELAVSQAAVRVTASPDNPAIKRHGGTTSGFTIGFQELQRRGGWDVFRHDWVAQYEYAAALIRARRFAQLRELVEKGSVREPGYGGARPFAHEVVERLRAIVGDMQLAADPGELYALRAGGTGDVVPAQNAAHTPQVARGTRRQP